MQEKRSSDRETEYIEYKIKVDEMFKDYKGNGKKGFSDRILRLEILMWFVIILLVSNGGLLAANLYFNK
jgi:hypothetical protein